MGHDAQQVSQPTVLARGDISFSRMTHTREQCQIRQLTASFFLDFYYSHNPQNAEPELVPESTPDPNMLAPQPDKPEHRRHSDLFPTPPERRKLVTSSPPCADRLGMEWWDFSPSPEPEANLAGRNAIRHSMNVDEPLSKCECPTLSTLLRGGLVSDLIPEWLLGYPSFSFRS